MPITIFSQAAIVIQADQGWQATGISINSGDMVSIIAKGQWAYGQGAPDNVLEPWIGPEGRSEGSAPENQNFLLPNATYQTLIYKIGVSGNPGKVGGHAKFTSSESGMLYLAMNDNSFGDNHGSIVSFIFINPMPTDVNQDQRIDNVQEFEISQNYPNPFNPTTTINYSVPTASSAQILIYDINGQLIKTLINEFKNAGQYSINWDSRNENGISVSSGTYFYQVQVGDFLDTKKMILLK